MLRVVLFFSIFVRTILVAQQDSIGISNKLIKDNPTERSPKKALVYSAICPGLGQIYNKKTWKLPIVYTGIGVAGGLFAYNHIKYKRFKNAYIKALANEPITDPYLSQFNPTQLYDIQDQYRTNRDLTGIIVLGVYALQMLDAYVDAHLADFDMPTTTWKIRPTLQPINYTQQYQIGVHYSAFF